MEKLMTPEEVVEWLGIKLSTLYAWTHQKAIPHVKLGNLLRFRKNDILKWLESRSVKGRKTTRIDIRDLL
ncbi:MAG: helix-turn-helix domain-containing protein [candidate division Zixibacteria bacterium]|nr:helix-turn-helix domain-containing protein [candidate division Zixibacteria bacterium]